MQMTPKRHAEGSVMASTGPPEFWNSSTLRLVPPSKTAISEALTESPCPPLGMGPKAAQRVEPEVAVMLLFLVPLATSKHLVESADRDPYHRACGAHTTALRHDLIPDNARFLAIFDDEGICGAGDASNDVVVAREP